MKTRYIDADEANYWCAERGIVAFTDIPDRDKPQLLLRASEWIDQQFLFTGKRLSATQVRAWPRQQAVDNDGRVINGTPDVVVTAVITLCVLLADDQDAAEQAMGISPSILQQKAGGIDIRYNHQQSGKPSKIASLLAPVLRHRRDIRVERG